MKNWVLNEANGLQSNLRGRESREENRTLLVMWRALRVTVLQNQFLLKLVFDTPVCSERDFLVLPQKSSEDFV